jgi:hypothetical protein
MCEALLAHLIDAISSDPQDPHRFGLRPAFPKTETAQAMTDTERDIDRQLALRR